MDHSSCILAIDDDLANLELLTAILDSKGYASKTALNGSAAIQIAQDEPIDLILLDVNMPEKNGYEVCTWFKADYRLRDIPIIFLSAADTTANKVKGFEVGGVDYIAKPFHYDELVARIDVHLSLRYTQMHLEAPHPQGEIITRQETPVTRRDSEAFLAQAQQMAHLGSWEWDIKTDLVTWSQELYHIYGVDPQLYHPTFTGVFEAVHPDDRELAKRVFEERMRTRQIVDYTYRIIRPNGDIRVLFARGQVIVDDAGIPVSMFGTAQDITEQQQVEEQLRASKEKYQALFEHTNDAVFIIGLDLRTIETNQQAADMLGYSMNEVVGTLFTDLIVPDEQSACIANIYRLVAGEKLPIYVRTLRRKNGKSLPTEISATLISSAEGTPLHIYSVVRDISERKQLEEALRESERRYRQLIENASDLVYTTDEQGYFTYANSVSERITGYTPEALIGKRFTETIAPAWRERVYDFYVKQLVEQRHETCFSFPVVTPTGEEKWVEQTTILLRDGDLIKGFQCICRDITERKIVETERERLIAELDAFSHTVAHDLKSPLSTLSLRSQTLETMFDLMSDKQRRDALQSIRHGTKKMSEIIDALLVLASVRKKADITIIPIEMVPLVDVAQQRLSDLITASNATVVVSDVLPTSLGYGPWIEEIWVNYLSNALKYSGASPHIEVGASTQADGMVRYWVKDTGAGILPEDLNRLFTPFTRINQVTTDGHGLGLSIVQRIVERLGGKVGVNSEVGQGSIFYFTLPTMR